MTEEDRTRLLAPRRFKWSNHAKVDTFSVEAMGRFSGSFLRSHCPAIQDLHPGSQNVARGEFFGACAQVLAIELRLSSLANALQGSDSAQRYASYIDALDQEWFHRHIIEKYPVLHSIADSLVSNALANERSCLDALLQDALPIEKMLGESVDSISDIVPLGDPHTGGLRSTRVDLKAGRSVIIKRRPATGDALAARLIGLANLDDFGLAVPARVDRDGWHWQEWAHENDVRSSPAFARALGGWLAFAHFSATTDLHAENLIPADGVVLGIDLECVGHGIAEYRSKYVGWGALGSTGILPVMMGASGDSPGFNYGAFGADASVSALQYRVQNDRTDRLEVRFSDPDPPASGADGRQTVSQYVDDLADAFDAAARRISRVSKTWRSVLSERRGGRRHVLRATQTYGDAWLKSSHPAALISANRHEAAVVSSLTRSCPPELLGLVESDAEEVIARNIPIYAESEDGTSIVGAPGIVLDSGASLVAERLTSELTDEALAAHRRTIVATCAAFSGPVIWRARDGRKPSERDARGLSQRIVDRVEASVRPGQVASWANLTRGLGGGWQLSHGVTNLYSGDLGIIAAAAVADVSGVANLPLALVDRMRQSILHLASLHLSSDQPAGLFEGTTGLQFSLAILADAEWLPKQRARDLINRLGRSVAKRVENTKAVDLISGSAGIGAVYPELHRGGYLDGELAMLTLDKVVGHLHSRSVAIRGGGAVWVDSEYGQWLGGLSHGVAGIALGLIRAAGVASEKALARELAKRAWDAQLSLLDRVTLDWEDRRPDYMTGGDRMNAWCHGQDGIALAWREILDVAPGQKGDYAAHLRSIEHRTPLSLDGDASICHGSAGEVLTALELGIPSKPGRWSTIQQRQMSLLEDDASEFSWMDLSLMCGKSGLLWGAALHKAGKNVASPLSLRLQR